MCGGRKDTDAYIPKVRENRYFGKRHYVGGIPDKWRRISKK